MKEFEISSNVATLKLDSYTKNNISNYTHKNNPQFIKNRSKVDTASLRLWTLDTVTGVTGVGVSLDSDNWYEGNPMVKLSYTGTGESAYAVKVLDTPVDLSTYDTIEIVVNLDKAAVAIPF